MCCIAALWPVKSFLWTICLTPNIEFGCANPSEKVGIACLAPSLSYHLKSIQKVVDELQTARQLGESWFQIVLIVQTPCSICVLCTYTPVEWCEISRSAPSDHWSRGRTPPRWGRRTCWVPGCSCAFPWRTPSCAAQHGPCYPRTPVGVNGG